MGSSHRNREPRQEAGAIEQRNDSKPVIGLTGGIGAGKTTVARLFAALGAAVIEADKLSHEELSSADVVRTLQRWWGKDVIDEHGEPDRRRIAEIAFADPVQRKRLEQLLHPRIARRRAELIAGYRADPQIRAIVLDTPLLFEAGLADECDRLVFVDADHAARLARVCERRGWTAEELDRRENCQRPLEFKRASADYVVVNNSDVASLAAQVEQVLRHILSHQTV